MYTVRLYVYACLCVGVRACVCVWAFSETTKQCEMTTKLQLHTETFGCQKLWLNTILICYKIVIQEN